MIDISIRVLSRLRTVLAILAVAGLVAGTILTWNYFSTQRKIAADAKTRARDETVRTAKAIDTLLRQAEPVARTVADAAGKDGFDDQVVAAQLESNHDLSGAGLAYEPNASPGNGRLYAPYYNSGHNGEAPERVRLDALYDYTKFDNRWYNDPILDGAMWTAPRAVAPNQPMVVGYCMPFAGKTPAAVPGESPEPGGIAIADIAVSRIGALVDAMALGSSGYGMVFTNEGRYVSHPRNELVTSEKTVFDTAWSSGDTALHSMAIRGMRGESGVVDRVDPVTGQNTWVFFEPIPEAKWTLATVFFRDNLYQDTSATRQSLIRIVVSFLIAAMALSALFVVSKPRLTMGWLWLLSALCGIIPALGIAGIWYVSDAFPRLQPREAIVDGTTLQRYLKTYLGDSGDTSGKSSATFVRTGIFVKSVEFTSSSNNVKVTGYIWQRYERGAQDALTRGVMLPDAEAPVLSEIYRRDEGPDQVIGWNFAAELREEFFYETYPLDRQEVWVRMVHPDFHQNVFLIPDLDAYSVSDPFARPGVNAGLVLPGWTISRSFFDFRLANYNTNFGFSSFTNTDRLPELHFDILLRRNISEPFVSRIIPLLVTLSMLFAMLLIGSKAVDKRAAFGFTSMSILLGCSGLLFTVIFAHMGLRQALSPSSIMYFEYFYFATYIAFMFVSINSILFASQTNIPLLHYGDNMISKLSFWPIFSTVLFAVTVVVFY